MVAFSDKLNFEILQSFSDQTIPFSLPFRHSLWKSDYNQGPVDVRLTSADMPRQDDRVPVAPQGEQ